MERGGIKVARGKLPEQMTFDEEPWDEQKPGMKRAMERVFLEEGTARSKSLRQKIDVFNLLP